MTQHDTIAVQEANLLQEKVVRKERRLDSNKEEKYMSYDLDIYDKDVVLAQVNQN